ncbi:MAG: hypothetical protein ACFCAD_28685 [Pleurocapsa sp.]
MKVQTVKSFAASFFMLAGLGYFLYYFQGQQRIMDEQHATLMQELDQMKTEAKQVKADLPLTKTEEISNEAREQTLKYIEECLDDKTCLFQLRGAATKQPAVCFIVLDDIWHSLFEEDNIAILREILRNKVSDASANPEFYVDIPYNAPFYPIAIKNTKNTKSYKVILSRGLIEGKLRIDDTVLAGT